MAWFGQGHQQGSWNVFRSLEKHSVAQETRTGFVVCGGDEYAESIG